MKPNPTKVFFKKNSCAFLQARELKHCEKVENNKDFAERRVQVDPEEERKLKLKTSIHKKVYCMHVYLFS